MFIIVTLYGMSETGYKYTAGSNSQVCQSYYKALIHYSSCMGDGWSYIPQCTSGKGERAKQVMVYKSLSMEDSFSFFFVY